MIATSPLHNIRGKNLCTPGLDSFPCSGLGLHQNIVPIRSPLSQVNTDGRDTVATTVFLVVIVVTGFVVELVTMIAVIVVVVGNSYYRTVVEVENTVGATVLCVHWFCCRSGLQDNNCLVN